MRLKAKSRKKSKTTAPKKGAKSSSKELSPPKHLPVSTFDAWISKQVKASNRGGYVEKEPSPPTESTKLPESTFDAWMRKQKPKESSSPKPQSSGSPDTFDLWINKRVAEWKEVPEKTGDEEETSVTASASSSE